MMSPVREPVPSPCISICRMDPALGADDERAAGGLCVGCLRTIDEIIDWGRADESQKRLIVGRIAQRRGG